MGQLSKPKLTLNLQSVHRLPHSQPVRTNLSREGELMVTFQLALFRAGDCNVMGVTYPGFGGSGLFLWGNFIRD